MQIRVVLYSLLRYKLAKDTKGKLSLDMPENSSIQDVLDRLMIDPPINVSMNNQIIGNFDDLLAENSEIHLFRPTGGG